MPRKLTQEEFILKAKAIHGDKYDYSRVIYINNSTKVEIICSIHGIFNQQPQSHVNGKSGCGKCCSDLRGANQESFIKKAKAVHGDKYDYSRVIYKESRVKVKIICSIHGEFEQIPNDHTNNKHGCPKCANNKPNKNTKYFIEKSEKIHGNKFDYSKVNYVDTFTKVDIICKKHGIFKQSPTNHYKTTISCPVCLKENIETGLNTFLKKVKEKHGDKYDYSLMTYKNTITKIKIKCPIHGIFEQKPEVHYRCGCPKCGGRLSLTTNEFIQKSIKKHGNKYDYSKVIYKNLNIKIEIVCPEHSSFFQKPNDHLSGCGCPKCFESGGEKEIRKYLEKNNIIYGKEKKFENCRGKKYKLPFDFYLPDLNILIEFDGGQHFKSVSFFGGEEGLKKTKIRDEIKNNFAKDNNIKLIRIRYDQINDVEKILNEELDLVTSLG